MHEFWDHGKYVFIAPDTYDEKVMTKKWNDQSKALFTRVLNVFENITNWTSQTIHDDFENLVKEAGKIDMQLLRVLITGVAGGPQLFDMMALIGKEESVKRLSTALSKL